MEVHHHAHTARKKWTHYFWEFLMLFLAVFCGFLAEYQLEHKIEKDRAKIYIKNLYEDLKADTSIYSTYLQNVSQTLTEIDSLIILMKSPELNAQLSKIYFLARTATMSTFRVYPNTTTFDEMKQGGQLRLIANRVVADSISYYYNSLNMLAAHNEIVFERVGDYQAELGNVFDAEILLRIFKERKEPAPGLVSLANDDPIVINRFLAKAQNLYGTTSFQKSHAIERKTLVKNLIELIKKEYHFK